MSNAQASHEPQFTLNATWFNAEEAFSLDELRGKVTLVHFWDYTNLHCLDSLTYVKAWQQRYEHKGLTIVGVHTPEFPFGESPVGVQTAIQALDLTYPIFLDNDYQSWESFQNLTWPGFHVVDPKGGLVYSDAGDCGYQNIESVIHDQLHGHLGAKKLPDLMDAVRPRDEPGLAMWDVTPNIVTGYDFLQIGNEEGFEPHRVVTYEPHPGEMQEGLFYLRGKWLNHRYSVAAAKSHEGVDATITIPYTASEVNIVVHPQGDMGFLIEVLDNGEPLPKASAGEHLRMTGKGKTRKSELLVSDTKMYRIINHGSVRSGVLEMTAHSSGFALYGINFVGSIDKDGEPTPTLVKQMVKGKAKARKSVIALAEEAAKEAKKRAVEEKAAAKKEKAAAKKEKAAAKKEKAAPKKAAPKKAGRKGIAAKDADGAAAEVLRTRVGKKPAKARKKK